MTAHRLYSYEYTVHRCDDDMLIVQYVCITAYIVLYSGCCLPHNVLRSVRQFKDEMSTNLQNSGNDTGALCGMALTPLVIHIYNIK